MTAIALDDEPPALEVLAAFCQRIDFIDLLQVFSRTGEASRFLEQMPVDILFLDINMPNTTGLEFCQTVPPDTMVIFTTAYSEYAVESYNLNAIDYLLKPFTFKRFLQSVEKAHTNFQLRQQATATNQPPSQLSLRVDYGTAKIEVADILYIEGWDNYAQIHLASGQKRLVVRMTLKTLLEKLPKKDFIRVHRSFIVPLARIGFVRNKIIHIGDKEIPIGSAFEEGFLGRFGRVDL